MSRFTTMLPRSISSSRHAQAVAAAVEGALAAADPAEAVHRYFALEGDVFLAGGTEYTLFTVRRMALVGAGKAAEPMARAVVELMSPRIDTGLILVHEGSLGAPLIGRGISVREAGHPVPTASGVKGAEEIMAIATCLGAPDLLLVLVSGGASALLTLPAEGLTLDDLRDTTALLLSAGADIKSVNAVRKHLSRISGGQLAKAACPAKVVSLVLSDVIGDDLDVIGSGPTVPDPTTFADAWAVLARHGILSRVPDAVQAHLMSGIEGALPETPKPGDAAFFGVQNLIVGSNGHARDGAADALRKRGFDVRVEPHPYEGEARDMGIRAARMAKELTATRGATATPRCILLGGETTVTLRGKGKGGRNQELALAAAVAMEGLSNAMIVALATDGRDGPTDAAGAVATGKTAQEARARGMDPRRYLDANDAYSFFKPLSDLIITGPTRTNVADILMIIAE